MIPDIVHGDLLEQDVDMIVNAWNRNIIPWWLLIPQGVSGAIKRRGGTRPFKELVKLGAIPLGEARLTSAGALQYRGIIHVAGINLFWVATRYSVTQSVLNAMALAEAHQCERIAFPLIGSGSGQRGQQWSLDVMLDAFSTIDSPLRVVIVQYKA